MKRLLFLVPALLFACAQERIKGTPPPDMQVDSYLQIPSSKVDVLWVVDDSGSMAPRQENLAKNFQSFIDLFTKGSIDFRIGVTTTDIFKTPGSLRGSPKVITPTTPSVLSAFAANIKVGTDGSPYEAGMQAALLVLDKYNADNAPKLATLETCKQACNKQTDVTACQKTCDTKTPIDFLRPDAYLYIIFVSDEEDESEKDVRYYWRAFETAKGVGNDGTVTTAAIKGEDKNTCGANPGTRYQALSDLTGGEVGSICDASFANTLKKLATSAVGLKRKFALSKAPNVATIKVTFKYPCNTPADTIAACASVDRTACEGVPVDAVALKCTPVQGGADGWTYEPMNRIIAFAGESLPGLKSQIDIEYYEEGKGPK